MLLIAVLVPVMAFALVACNNDKKNNNSDSVEMTEGIKKVVEESKSDIDALFNYFLVAAEAIDANAEEGTASFNLEYYNVDPRDTDFTGGFVRVGFHAEDEDFEWAVFENEADAKSAYDAEKDEYEGVVRDGKKIISDNAVYQKALQSKRPSTIKKFAQEQIEFMEGKLHRGIDKNESNTVAPFYFDVEEGAVAYWYMEPMKGNCDAMEGYMPYDKDNVSIANEQKFMSINYTDDSYIKINEQAGYYYAKLINKPGWHIDEITDYHYNEQTQDYENVGTGKYRANYFYNELPATLTVPAKIGEYDIERAELYLNDEDALNAVVVEKAIGEVRLSGKIKEITIPVSDKPFVRVSDNTALKTINFGGTTQQWEEQYKNLAQDWTHVYDHYDEEKEESVYVDITFTVVCTNGNITYPKAQA